MSLVWKFFDKLDSGKKVKCRLCAKELLHNTSTTGTMVNHLKHVHPMQYSNSISSPSESSATAKDQTKVTSFFSAASTTCSKSKSDKITSLIADLIVGNVLPLKLVDDTNFKNLINFLEPKYVVPSRKTITAVIERKYDSIHDDLKMKLATSGSVSLTTDCWTSMTAASFMTVTCHYINNDWVLENYVLSTRALEENHTANNLRRALEEVVSEFDLQPKVLACVSDNAANVVRALKDCTVVKERQACAVHTLQLSVNDGLNNVQSLRKTITAASRLVAHIKRSSKATLGLASKQQQFNLPEHKLIQSVVTRWNSVCDMFDRLVEQRWAVSALLNDRAYTSVSDARALELSDSNWLVMDQMLTILRTLKLTTNALGADKSATSSAVGPLIDALVHKHLLVNDEDSVSVSNFKSRVSTDLKKRFDYILMDGLDVNGSHVASFLDPRHKHLPFISSEDKKMRVQALVREKMIFNEPDVDNDTVPDPSDEHGKRPRLDDASSASTSEDAMSLLLGESYTRPPLNITEVDSFQAEIQRYVQLPQLAMHENPLVWWLNHKDDYPRLSKVAQAYLAIPASSVSSERLFSAAGRVVTKNRSRLTSRNVNAILFLNKNQQRL